jgi:small neutral amino acid transporter SnatA (MarC family)
MEAGFVSAVALLLLVLDPFGNVPLFISALREVPRARRTWVVVRECLIAFAVLTLFAVSGRPLLDLLGLSEVSLQIGGAVVLMLVAIRMVFPPPEGVFGPLPGGEPFIVPLAVPALAGPSAVATVLLLVSREPAKTMWWIAAIALALVASAMVLAFADRLQRWLGSRVTVAFERLMGLVLAAMAVEMMLRGIERFVERL